MIVSAVVTTLLTGLDPVGVFKTMADGAFGTSRKVWMLFQEIAILLCVSLALAPAFRMKFWNLGGEGQILIGALAAAACMLHESGSGASFAGDYSGLQYDGGREIGRASCRERV